MKLQKFIPLVFAVFVLLISFVNSWNDSDDITIQGIEPNAGPTSGETHVIVRLKNFNPDLIASFPHPKCRFGSLQVGATFAKCSPKPRKPGERIPTTAEKTEICVQCEDTEAHEEGNVPFTVSLLGDFTDTTNSLSFRFYQEPKIKWISPRYGLKDGGTIVDVYGTGFLNFDQNLRCGFGSREVKGKFIDSNHIQCVSPFSSVVQRKLPFSISLNNQQNTKEDIPYVYYENPTVYRLEPTNRGPDSGYTVIHLRGAGFNPLKDLKDMNNANETFCEFSTLGRCPAKVISSTEVECITPPSYELTQTPVEVTLNNQQWTDDDVQFYYYHPPYTYYISPRIGPISGGTKVMVYGGNFENTTIVRCKFGDKLGEGKYINSNQLLCISPPVEKPAIVPLRVATREDEYSSGLNTKYTYYADPKIHFIEPICGPEQGFTQITVYGENFPVGYSNSVKCIFNGEIRTDATVMSFDIIKCDSPPIPTVPGKDGLSNNEVELMLVINEEKAGPAQKFYYYKSPIITGLSPIMGGVEGDTTVKISGTGFNQPGACNITARFATYHAKPLLVDNNYLIVKSPEANYTGSVVVQVALNGQQFEKDITFHFRDQQNTFYYYKCPVVVKINPEEGPSVGGNDIYIFGIGFLEPFFALGKENNVKAPLYNADLQKTIYYRFADIKEEDIYYGDVQSTVIEDGSTQRIIIKSPSIIKSPNYRGRNNIVTKVQLSYDGEVFCDYGVSYTFFNLPNIEGLNPKYAHLGTKNPYTELKLDNLNCNSDDCSKGIKCRFRATAEGSNKEFILPGTYLDVNKVKCSAPNVNIPEEFNVEMSINGGLDYTNNGLTYTYYDPFVLRVEPQMLSSRGGTQLKITGYGFADTGKNVKVMFGDSDKQKYDCDSSKCTADYVKYINSTTILTKSKAKGEITDKATGDSVANYKKIPVEVAIYNDDFTNNKVGVFYYQDPKIVNDIFSTNGIPLHLSSSEKDRLKEVLLKSIPCNIDTFIPIPVDGSDLESHLKEIEHFTNYSCRFDINDKQKITDGVYTRFPLNNTVHNLFLCQSPQFINEIGNCKVRISMNGYDFSEDEYNLELTDPINIYKVYPACGPIEGGTPIRLFGTGFKNSESSVFKWGPQNLVPMNRNNFFETVEDETSREKLLGLQNFVMNSHKDNATEAEKMLESLEDVEINEISVTAPSAPNDNVILKTRGGLDYISISKTNLLPLDDFLKEYYANSFIHSNFEYYYYRQIYIEDFTPSGSISTGGAKVTVIGAWFQNKPEYDLKPYCKFGNKIVPGEYISTVRIVCEAPPSSEENVIVPLYVSLNGQDFVRAPKDFKYYSDFKNAKFEDVVPSSGPSSGGTNIKIYGSGFSTMFDETEFMCQFEPVETKMVEEDGKGILKEIKSKMEPRNVPAKLSATSSSGTTREGTFIECNTPGGWPAGSKTNVRIAFDGQNFLDTGKDFYFYEVKEISPCAGPNTGEGETSFVGGGFKDNGNITFTMNGITYKPLKITENKIICDIPEMSNNYTGYVDMSIFLNGVEEKKYNDAFYYYNQPSAYSVYPKTGPSRGNPVFHVFGQGFKDNFRCANVGCRIGAVYGKGKVISDKEIECSFTNIPVDTNEYYMMNQEGSDSDESEENEELVRKGHIIQISLNNASFVGESEDLMINTYALEEITPVSGPIDSGTTILVKGAGFTESDNIRCRFGVPGYYAYTEGTFLDYNKISCPSPQGFDIPPGGELPFTVPFSIALNEDEFNPWTQTSHVFTFYQNPEVVVASPTETSTRTVTPVFLKVEENEDEQYFSMPSASIREDEYIVLDKEGKFVTKTKKSIKYQPIVCKFGKYGITEADYVNKTDINCLTPNFNDDSDIVYEEIPIEIAENGVDFIEAGKINFQGQQAKSVGCMYCVLAVLGVLFLAALAALIAWMASKKMMGIDGDMPNEPHVRGKKLRYILEDENENKDDDNLPSH